MRIFAGAYSWSETRPHGVAVLNADTAMGALTLEGIFTDIANPFHLALSPSGRTLYVADNVPEGRVHALRVGVDGTLSPLNDRPTGGKGTVHVAVHHDHVYAVNHDSGELVVFPARSDGSLAPAAHLVRHLGVGPDPVNQLGPHPHMSLPDPTGSRLLVADKGNDHVYVYRLDEGIPKPHSQVHLGPGVGPRHLVFHPRGHRLYVVGELASTITVCGYDLATGALWTIGTVATLLEDSEEWNAPSGIAISADGRFVYVLNRGHESITALRVEGDDLLPVGAVRFGEAFTTMPWDLVLDPSGTTMFVANQLAGTVIALAVDPATGMPRPLGDGVKVSDVACLTFG